MTSNAITLTPTTITMTSLEMVEFINNLRNEDEGVLTHDNFLKKVPKVLKEHAVQFNAMFTVLLGNGATRQSPGYRFPKREATLMAMSYSYEMQAAVFDHMTKLEDELKARNALPDFTNPAIAARAYADQYERADKAERLNLENAPKVELAESFMASTDTISIGQMAKILKKNGFDTGSVRLGERLRADGLLLQDKTPAQKYSDYFELDEKPFTSDSGRTHITLVVRVTPKGQEYLINRYVTKPAKERARIAKNAAANAPKRIEQSREQKQKGGLFDRNRIHAVQ